MKLLFLCHKTPYPANDGGAIASLNMITGFRDMGADVSVLTMQTYKHSFLLNKFPAEIRNHINWNQQWVKTKINPVKLLINLIFSKRPYNAQRFVNKGFSKKLVQLLQKNTYDLVQLEGAYLEPYVDIIRKHSDAMVALRAHNIEAQIWNRLADSEQNIVKKQYYRILSRRVDAMEKKLLKKIDLLVPITHSDAQKLSFYNLEKVHVSPTGITLDKFAFKHIVNEKTFFYLGALDWVPNQEGILWFLEKVWYTIKSKYPDWEFAIAGRNAPKNFEKKLQAYDIKYHGEIPDATTFMDAHQIMLVPLFAGSGMRIKIIEAMARGKCVITTPIGIEGIPVKNKNEAYICEQPNDWINAIETLVNDWAKIQECRQKAYKFAQQKYANQGLINRLFAFYKQQIG